MRAFGIALLLVTAGSQVFADSLVARYGPAYTAGGLYVDVSGVSAPRLLPVSGAGYTVTMSPQNGDTDRGVVIGDTAQHAMPEASSDGLTGTPWTENYLSTGNAGEFITIDFDTPQTGLTFLWGSVDTYNYLCFGVGCQQLGNQVNWITGTAAGSAAGLTPIIGSQSFKGSAYVLINRTTPFEQVTFWSDPSYAFEIADIRAVPDGGMTLLLLGGALVGLETLRRRYRG